MIKNKKELMLHGYKDIRRALLDIADRALEEIRADKILRNFVKFKGDTLVIKDKDFNIDSKTIYVVGFGKAVIPMAKEIENILRQRLKGGIINSPYPAKLNKIKVNRASHPYPDERTLKASKQILKFINSLENNAILLILISGGASSLFEIPEDGLSIEEEREIIKDVMLGGADIFELNSLRMALSKVKGGKFLKYIYPRRCISIIISDVIGPPQFVGSGPTYPQGYDMKILERYGIKVKKEKERIPSEICQNMVIADNEYAKSIAYNIARAKGYPARISKNKLWGEPKDMAKIIANEMKDFKGIMIWGGETSVRVKGNGIGGRNQELTLHLAKEIEDEDIGFICLGTDGIDGNSPAAGGLVDGMSLKRIKENRIDLEKELENNNSYFVLSKLKDAVITGHTGTNLADICIGFHN